MKKIILSFLVSSLLIFSGCLKENHSVCFKNDYAQTMYNVSAGSTKIGTVATGKRSNYFSINAGNFKISGATAGGQTLEGSGSVSGRGTHKWTITLSSSGGLSIAKD